MRLFSIKIWLQQHHQRRSAVRAQIGCRYESWRCNLIQFANLVVLEEYRYTDGTVSADYLHLEHGQQQNTLSFFGNSNTNVIRGR